MNIAGEIGRQNLRYILLFESYFNFSNKLYFGSRCMKRAYILGVITQEHYNGRSGHTSIEVELLRRVLFEYVRQARNNDVIGSYDGEKSYGCVAHNFA